MTIWYVECVWTYGIFSEKIRAVRGILEKGWLIDDNHQGIRTLRLLGYKHGITNMPIKATQVISSPPWYS